MRARAVVLFGSMVVLFVWSPVARGQCVNADPFFSGSGNPIRVTNGFGASSSLLDSGISYWQTCPGYGTTMPYFSTDAMSAPQEVDVYY